MNKKIVAYLAIVSILLILSYLIIKQGNVLETGILNKSTNMAAVGNANLNTVLKTNQSDILKDFLKEFTDTLKSPFSVLVIQIITIIIFSRMFGFFATKIKQPSVIGEIIAGIVLGPSVLGFFFPNISLFLFPKASLVNLGLFSQVGLILFMFIIGMELDLHLLRNKSKEALIISHVSIIFPFFLGILLSYYIYKSFAPRGVSFLAFSLFMGISMSITAFPVLARIIQERKLTKTHLGVMAVACASIDDITAWCILAIVIAIVKTGSILGALITISLAMLYIFFMIYCIKPIVEKVLSKQISSEKINLPVVAFVLVIVLFSSYITENIGIHALFGAFLAGTILPQNTNFKKLFTEKIEDISFVLLLPIFFVITGLRTQIGLLNEGYLWIICLLILLTAVFGKFIGASLISRLVGESWETSLSIGALMNTRGLMELIVINIGYDLGILSPKMFAIMLLMALFTTFMTGPILDLINKLFKNYNTI